MFVCRKLSKILINRITEITERKPSEFNIFEIAAIENHAQDNLHKDRFPNVLVRATRDLLNALVKKDTSATCSILESLLKKEHPIFKRLALSAISNNWQKCSILYESFAGKHMFNDYNIRHEIYTLLKNNFNSFTSEEKNNIINWIELGPERLSGDSIDEGRLAFWRQMWLSAIVPTGYPKAVELYEKYKTITKTDPEHPDFSSWMETRWGPDPSPISVDILLEKSNSDIANYLSVYEEEGRKWRSPSKEGLEHVLAEAVKTHPEKFQVDLESFTKVPINYQCQILSGFRQAWEEKREIDWANIFSFFMCVVKQDGFWSKSGLDTGYNNRDVFVSEMADLVTAGTRDDSRAFPQKYLPIAEELLLMLLTKTESKLERPDDLLSDVLNSAKGRALTALINYSLRVARLSGPNVDVKWPQKVKYEFTRRLDPSIEPDLRFSLTLGRYLANLYYLDRQWVEDNINLILPKDKKDHWEAAIEGYLLECNVYSRIYDLLRKNGHYDKALETNFHAGEANKHLVEHLCVGYLLEKERLDDECSPFCKCLDIWNTETVTEIIWFFWSQREFLVSHETNNGQDNQQETASKQKTRILDFWRFIYGILKTKAILTENEQKVASELVKLSCYLDILNIESIEWLTFSVKYVEKNLNSAFLIEYLLRLCDVSSSKVGSVYVSMLDNSTPVYDQKNIKIIVTKLYESGEIDIANRICNIYGSRGVEFLRDIYRLNNK